MIENWLIAAKWIIKDNGWKLIGMGGTALISLLSTKSSGKSGYRLHVEGKAKEIEKAKIVEKKMESLGQLERNPEDAAIEDSEKKMFALRAFILSWCYRDDAGNFFITLDDDEFMAHIDNFSAAMNVIVTKKFEGSEVPMNKVCFDVKGFREVRTRDKETGIETMEPKFWWKKNLKSTIVLDRDLKTPKLWFTWPKAML